jgi:hypothetical protein
VLRIRCHLGQAKLPLEKKIRRFLAVMKQTASPTFHAIYPRSAVFSIYWITPRHNVRAANSPRCSRCLLVPQNRSIAAPAKIETLSLHELAPRHGYCSSAIRICSFGVARVVIFALSGLGAVGMDSEKGYEKKSRKTHELRPEIKCKRFSGNSPNNHFLK